MVIPFSDLSCERDKKEPTPGTTCDANDILNYKPMLPLRDKRQLLYIKALVVTPMRHLWGRFLLRDATGMRLLLRYLPTARPIPLAPSSVLIIHWCQIVTRKGAENRHSSGKKPRDDISLAIPNPTTTLAWHVLFEQSFIKHSENTRASVQNIHKFL